MKAFCKTTLRIKSIGSLILYFALVLSSNLFITDLQAACGGTVRTWDAGAGTNKWDNASNWDPDNMPNSPTEDAVIVAMAKPTKAQENVTIGCLDIQSGVIITRNDRTITIAGDYFRNPYLNGLAIDVGITFYLIMAGSAAQTFENYDPINYLEITNDTSVTFTYPFTIRNTLALNGTGTTLYVNGDLNLSDATGTFTIPSSNTVEVASGVTLNIAGDLTIAGTLLLNAGASLVMGSGKTITVSSGGLLKLNGASGNVASIDGNGGYYDMAVAGNIWANYFRIDRVGADTTGLNVTGTIQSMDNGEFHYINNNGYGITLNAATSVPSLLDGIGFYDDSGFGTAKSINATSFDLSDVTVDHWSGLGCSTDSCANETDPNGRIFWGDQAGTVLTISSNNNSGKPVDPVIAGDPSDEFAIFSFALNQTSTATDITSVTFTLTGSGSSSDVDYIQVFNQGASCQTVGTQIGSDLTMSGTPAKATVTIPAATVTTSSTTPACIHVYLKTTSSAENAQTIGVEVSGTSDVVNSQSYSFSDTSGPPVNGGTVTISGDETRLWKGQTSSNWRTNTNWQNGVWPRTGVNCKIGSGLNDLILTEDNICQNMTMIPGGVMNFSSAAYNITAEAKLDIDAGFTFSNATNGTLVMGGSASQSMTIGTAFPGDVDINNSGGASSIISVDGDSTINGNLTVTSGTLRVATGVTLNVLGSITVYTGAVLDVEPSGTVAMGNGSVITINSGATLELVGNGNDAHITGISVGNAYTVVVNGTIKAQNYIFDHLGLTGVTINSGAIIDGIDNLSSGTFKHPVNDNTAMLRLYLQIPGDTLSDMTFDMNGSSASAATITNIYTDGSVTAGTLTISSYTGDLGGVTYDDDNSYLISWSGASNTIDLTQEASSPTDVYQGQTYNMGRFGFKQNLAGVSYLDADITSLTLTLTGTGSANDVDGVRIYYDSDCDGASGTLLGSEGTFSGSPAKITFSGLIGATVDAHLTTPPIRCIYVEYDIASDATNSATVGVKIYQSADVIDDQTYGVSTGTPPPVDLGTASNIIGSSTTWVGTIDSDWTDAGNWNGGVPTAALNCVINSAANNPVISAGTELCNSVDIGSGNLTIAGGATLQVYGSFTNSGTLNQTGTLSFVDNGSTQTNQTVETTGNFLGTVIMDKDAGGYVSFVGSSFTISSLTMNGANNNYAFGIGSGQTLVLPNGVTINNGTLKVGAAATVEVGNGQTITVAGGHLWLNGTPEAFPQNLATKAKVTVSGAGTWNFSATSGSVTMSGFHIDYISTSGMLLSGSTDLNSLTGGQFTNLSNSYSSVRAIQLNTTGSIPIASTNVGWNWDPSNTTPASSEAYTLVYSSGCASQSIDFTGWFGDWFDTITPNFDTSTKVSGTNCTITLGGAATAVTMIDLSAVGYNNSVDLRWVTGIESDHLGFNVFRSDEDGSNFIQINSSLIRNFSTSTDYHGRYRFIDYEVNNGSRYYYYVQDVAFNGTMTMHGPVLALPEDGLGMPPADDSDENSGSNPGGGDNSDPVVFNPSYKNLGDGIEILSQTINSLRVKIVPEDVSYSGSQWDASYQNVAIDGYSKMLDIGKPELLEKTLLIKVEDGSSIASIIDSNIDEIVIDDHQIVPAPSWSPDNEGVLRASWSLDSSVYNGNYYYPENFLTVHPDIITIGKDSFLKIKINPLRFNPIESRLIKSQQIILDIGLDGSSWQQPMPADNRGESAYIAPNTLRIFYHQSGIYKISYADLVDANAEGPFAQIDIDELRLYHTGSEIPIEIFSDDQLFSEGDYIRAYLPYFSTFEDNYNVAILSTVSLLEDDESQARRIDDLDGAIDDRQESTQSNSTYLASSERDLAINFSDPVGYGLDKFFWKMIWSPDPSLSNRSLTIPIDLPHINSESMENVVVKIYLKGTYGINHDLTHHVAIFINNVIHPLGDEIFATDRPQVLSFEVPAYYFYQGTNEVRVEVLGDQVPAGDYDVVLIDKAELLYAGFREMNDGIAHIKNREKDAVIDVDGISSTDDLRIYDVSDVDNIKSIVNYSVIDHGEDYSISFFANSGDYYTNGVEFFVLQEDEGLSVDHLYLTTGYNEALRSLGRGADLIIVGSKTLLDSAEDLIDRRESEGLRVAAVDIEQIYSEFSFGKQSSAAIRSFVDFATRYWQTPAAKYLLLLGDATYDPKNHLGHDNLSEHTMPISLISGQISDFGSDNFLATDTTSNLDNLPSLAIGRLPTSDPVKVRNYIDKLISYEEGDRVPEDGIKKISFIADRSDNNETFSRQTNSLAALEMLERSSFTTETIDRSDMDNGQLNQEILQRFASPPFIISYLGHGAEDRWAALDVFKLADAANLSNEKLPIVVTLNCLNGHFYHANPETISMGEELVLNADGGAVLFVGSTTLTTPTAQFQFAEAFYNQLGTILKGNNRNVRFGEIFHQAKHMLGDTPYSKDVLQSYLIFGDPSMKIPSSAFSPEQNDSPPSSKPVRGGGCSANASTGTAASSSWFFGFLEYLFFIVMIKSSSHFWLRKN